MGGSLPGRKTGRRRQPRPRHQRYENELVHGVLTFSNGRGFATDRQRLGLPLRIEQLTQWLGGRTQVEAIPVSRETPDGSLLSFWAHPERALDRAARDATSGFARMSPVVVDRVVSHVDRDLRNGTWDARYGHLRTLDAFDAGLRIVVNTPL